YSDPVRAWACAAAPIRDPDSNLLLGSIDLTGNEMVESPYCLALVKAASAACQAEIKSKRNLLASRFASMVQRADRKVGSALLDRYGVVISTSPEGWISGRIELDTTRMSATLSGGYEVPVERLTGNEGYLLRADLSFGSDPEVRIETLGRKEAVVRLMGQEIKLSCRQSEIAVILALNPTGVTAEQVAVFLYGNEVSPVTVRAEMSRLRKLLGPKVVGSKPYRFL
ncbi:MAG: helix-turn-helix domain-containing protein, partial [Acidimicrobiaceae bacterium]|nr:helix-turn-helix domain-containing protein [Acidimicrobiaceae bacterium]